MEFKELTLNFKTLHQLTCFFFGKMLQCFDRVSVVHPELQRLISTCDVIQILIPASFSRLFDQIDIEFIEIITWLNSMNSIVNIVHCHQIASPWQHVIHHKIGSCHFSLYHVWCCTGA